MARDFATLSRFVHYADLTHLLHAHLYLGTSLEIMANNQRTQAAIDAFYAKHGKCCAGCDWWRWYNSMTGECIRTAPVSGADRISMLGMSASSLQPKAGHIMTLRDHVCGEFRDTGE